MLSVAVLLVAAASLPQFPQRQCARLRTPTTLAENTRRIQAALDAAPGTADAKGCVSVGPGDWPVKGVTVRSNTTLLIVPGARLVSKINVTATAVVNVDKAQHVEIGGGGGIHGHAEEAWSYFSDKDARMAPVAVDGSMSRPHTLLITDSRDVHVHHIFLHNSTDWTFRMDTSHDIFVDSVDIYVRPNASLLVCSTPSCTPRPPRRHPLSHVQGDERFPNNDGFDPESCTNVTLVNSAISVADDGICPKANAAPLIGLTVRNTTIRSRSVRNSGWNFRGNLTDILRYFSLFDGHFRQGAIKFGSNTGPGTMRDILFDNITIWSSNGGMKIQGRGGVRNSD